MQMQGSETTEDGYNLPFIGILFSDFNRNTKRQMVRKRDAVFKIPSPLD